MFTRAGLIASIAVTCLAMGSPPRALAADPELKLPSFEHLVRIATNSVNVTLGEWPLGIASWALDHAQDSGDSEDQEVRHIIHGLRAIHIHSFEFAADHQYEQADIEAVRNQLSAPGWNALAQIHQHGDKAENVDIYVSTEHELVNGIAIIASGPRKLTIVNIVGSIDPSKLAKVGSRLGLPAFPM